MHVFHKWQQWYVVKTELKSEHSYLEYPHWTRWYEIHERRVCDKCGRVEYRIRNSA